MYVCKVDGYIFSYPPSNDKAFQILSGTISSEFNRTGTFEFQIPPSNKHYKDGKFKKLTSVIRVYWSRTPNDEDLIFKGRILDSSKNFLGMITYKCEGWMSVLNDSVVKPTTGGASEQEKEKGEISRNVASFFKQIIDQHNTDVGTTKALHYSSSTIKGFDNLTVTFQIPNYEKTLDYLQSNFVGNESIGGQMWVQEENGTNYIYYYADDQMIPGDDDDDKKQYIQFGENLIDLTEQINASELYTIILAKGSVKNGDNTTDIGPFEITCTDSTKITKYGKIYHFEDFGEVASEAALRQKAQTMVDNNSGEVTSIDVTAVDLSLVDRTQYRLKVGYHIPFVSIPHGYNQSWMCTASSLDICNPQNSKYTLGVNPDTLTTKQMQMSRKLTSTMNKYSVEASRHNLILTADNTKVEVSSYTFYRTGNSVSLSFRVRYLVNARDNNPTIFTFDQAYNPLSPQNGTAYDEGPASGTSEGKGKYYTLRITGGTVQVLSNNVIARNDYVTGSITWVYNG